MEKMHFQNWVNCTYSMHAFASSVVVYYLSFTKYSAYASQACDNKGLPYREYHEINYTVIRL